MDVSLLLNNDAPSAGSKYPPALPLAAPLRTMDLLLKSPLPSCAIPIGRVAQLKLLPTSPISPPPQSPTMTRTSVPVRTPTPISSLSHRELSRVVGLKHRERARTQLENLERQVEDLRFEQEQLVAALQEQARPTAAPNNCSNEYTIDATGEIRVSERAEDAFGLSNALAESCSGWQGRVNGVVAITLLELVALRRNMLWAKSARSEVECAPKHLIDAALSRCINTEHLAMLRTLHEMWSERERFGVPYGLLPPSKTIMKSSGWLRRRPRRCQRCGRQRSAGMGHARSCTTITTSNDTDIE